VLTRGETYQLSKGEGGHKDSFLLGQEEKESKEGSQGIPGKETKLDEEKGKLIGKGEELRQQRVK